MAFVDKAKTALNYLAIAGILTVFPGTCAVSGVRGCRAEFQASSRAGVMAESIRNGKLDVGCIRDSRSLTTKLESAMGLEGRTKAGAAPTGRPEDKLARAKAEYRTEKFVEALETAVDEYRSKSKNASPDEKRKAQAHLAARLDDIFLALGSEKAPQGQKADYWFTFWTFPGLSYASSPAAAHTAFNENANRAWSIVAQECGR
ncbi:hypothetical protein L0Y65_00445 [Candidatus Micrarchaeota archaeon]|nr:hypothetical protein [Candidatus Micrarchaeota archaeon]